METHDKNETPRAEVLGHVYDKVVRCQRLLTWLHVILAVAIAFIFLSTRDYTHFAWWRRGSGSFQLFRVIIPIFPYALSGIWARNTAILSLPRVYGFCFTLVLGTAAFSWIYISHRVEAFSTWLDAPFYVALFIFCSVQAMAFALAATVLLDVEIWA